MAQTQNDRRATNHVDGGQYAWIRHCSLTYQAGAGGSHLHPFLAGDCDRLSGTGLCIRPMRHAQPQVWRHGGYAEYAFGRAGNYLVNYTYGTSLLIANVAIGITAVGYLTELFSLQLSPVGVGLMTIALLWITTFANFGGASVTGKIGGVTVWGVILPVVGVSTFGWFWFSPSTYAEAWNPHGLSFLQAASSSVAITLWAFLGMESACANADAVENPERNVPIAVLGGTVGAAVIYIASTNVMAGIVSNPELAASTAPFGLVFAHMFTPLVGQIIMGLMVLACIGSLLGWQFTIAQVFKSSADTGYFLPIFAKVNKAGTPIVAMLILLAAQTGLALLTISPDLTKQFDTLVNLAVVTNIVPYILSMAALMSIQKVANVPPRKRCSSTSSPGLRQPIATWRCTARAPRP